jgi:hypothetical protein
MEARVKRLWLADEFQRLELGRRVSLTLRE